jgi:hypothetical protein
MCENGKMRSIEIIPGIWGDKGDQWRVDFNYANVPMYPQNNNNKKFKNKCKKIESRQRMKKSLHFQYYQDNTTNFQYCICRRVCNQ